MTRDEAIDVMARRVIVAYLDVDTEDWWADFPEIGEHDWECIVLRVGAQVPDPDEAEWREAYALLSARAEA